LKVRVERTNPFGVKLGAAVDVNKRPVGLDTALIVTGADEPGKRFRLVTLATAVAVAPGVTTSKFGFTAAPKSQIRIDTVNGDANVLVRVVTESTALKLPNAVIV